MGLLARITWETASQRLNNQITARTVQLPWMLVKIIFYSFEGHLLAIAIRQAKQAAVPFLPNVVDENLRVFLAGVAAHHLQQLLPIYFRMRLNWSRQQYYRQYGGTHQAFAQNPVSQP